ncbi:MAG: glycosyl hydrolase family 20, partial [Alistipes sp.]|nr:glycosyl hydrolase family 20 [Alistipes sp.]
ATADDRSQIFYTEVGTEGEKLYTAPIVTDKPQRFAFRTRRAGARSPEAAVTAHWRKLQPKVKITSSIAESERFPYSNAEGYGRIARTSRVGVEGDWILYTFEEPVVCRRMEIATGNLQLPRFIFTAGYMELSYDGEHFERVAELKGGAAAIENPRRGIKAVRLVCTQSGNGENFVTVQEPKVYPVL